MAWRIAKPLGGNKEERAKLLNRVGFFWDDRETHKHKKVNRIDEERHRFSLQKFNISITNVIVQLGF